MHNQATVAGPASACLGCGAAMDPGDAHCRHCGRAVNPKIPWYHHRVPLLILIFCVLGPLGLGMLYRSPAFTVPQKLVVAVLSFAQLIAISIAANRMYQATLDEVMQQLGNYQ
jgi:hypothetical protein